MTIYSQKDKNVGNSTSHTLQLNISRNVRIKAYKTYFLRAAFNIR